MNYSGNMPDWHQYNPPQSGVNDVTSTAQNVNSGHLSFISNISPTCPTQLNGLNLSSEGLEKHQNVPNFNPRHFQPHLSNNISHSHNAADNNPLASMVQMQNCIGHYGPSNTRNPMVENLNGPMDPRNAAIGGINEEVGYRNNQVPLNGPISHLNGPNVMNMNAPHASIGPRNANVNSHATSRTGPPPSYVPCKGLCCNPDPNMSYQQWEKYCSYQNNATYRENIRSSAGYQADARRFGNDYNFRKDNFDGKEILSPMVPPPNAPNTDPHRRNFSDFKYRKDRLPSRGYPPSSGMLQNYPMQNYNYTGEYQKYPYNVKDYSKMSGMNVANQGMVKHAEQGFTMPQQKYNKQVPYQTGGAMMPTSMPSTSVSNPSMMPSAQNTYFNSQYPRNLTNSTDATHDCQEAAVNASMVNRMQTNAATMHTPSHPRYQEYQQKIAMERFWMENELREYARQPGYQSHPKYKDCVNKYRKILKLQQSVTYQGQMQQTPCVAASTVNTSAIPPINLQFDQNGVLINSNYMPEAFPRVQQTVNSQAPVDKQGKQDGNGIPEMANRNVQKPEQLVSQQHDGHATALCAEGMQKQDRYPAQKSLDQNQYEVQKGSESFDNLARNASNSVIQQKMSKEFANKPELDVRQFLANWDESEDEDGAGNSLPSAVLSDSTPVVVVGYENVDLSAKTLEGLEVSKPEAIPNVIRFENQEKSDIGVVPAQDCLTISYSAAENVEIAKDPTCNDIAKKAVVRPGSHIIQCISNGPDEVPTIHIVDNLEIGSILQVTNGQVTETLERQDAVPFFHEGTEVEVAAITLEADKFKKTDAGNTTEPTTTEYNADLGNLSKEEYVVEGSSPPKTAVESTSQTSRVGDQGLAVLPTSAKDSARDTNLKKQNSFASEESHNPDDISLPDLPTSECTPISTTLNTPIHSDNEESSERVEDLTIPTNPIEIIQNSPIISFTQSPTKREPYDHLDGEGTVRNKSADSLTANTDKNEPVTSAKSGKEKRASLSGTSASANNSEKVFALGNETETVEATSMRMTLTSGEYELKIVSTGAPNKSVQAYKNSTSERGTNESQAANPDALTKKSQAETNTKVAQWYSDSKKADNASQNVTSNSDPVDSDSGQDDVNYSGRRRVSTEMTRQTARAITTSRRSSSPTNDTAPRNSRAEDSCTTQIIKNNSPTSHSGKHLHSDKSRKSEALFAKESSPSEKRFNSNRSTRIDAKDSKSFWHAKLADRKKSISSDQTIFHKKRCLSENTKRSCGKTIVHHNKHTQEAATHKDKSCTVENPKGSDKSHNKPRVIENISIADSGERMRLLKEYRRIKYKSLNVGEAHDKGKDTQEASDYAASKKCHRSSNPDERSQSPCDNQLCQKDVARFKSPEEQEEKRANILKTFVTENINPDFAIQVANVNLKLKDDNHQKKLQHLREEAKSGGSLDAIKIEINVSCTERNTTERLLHENIKNAFAETIGHLTNSISNGARSNSTSITEIQCDKKMVCDKGDRRDYEKRNRSPHAVTETSAYNEAHENHDNTEMKLKEDTNNETLVSKKRQSSLSEQELIDDVYEGNESELASSALKTSRSEHAMVRRRSVHQDAEKKVAATSFCSEELKVSSDNSPYLESRNVNVQKKEHQETAVASSCRSARSFQDDATSRLNAVPSTSSGTVEPSLEDNYDNPLHVAPNESEDAGDRRADRWKRLKRDDGKFGNFDLYETTSGYVNPTFFSSDKLENLNTVPVYTTKDGKITYSPNPRLYRELIMEPRAKDGYGNSREQYFARSPSYDYYNCSKLRKIFKRNRDVTGRKREIDPVDAKPAAKHVDYLSSKNAHKNANCAKTRGASHLEFFNDDADKLYANKSGQESKESNKKNIVDLDFLEKQYNLDNEPASNIKPCKTKVFADNLEYEKGYGESSVFDSNLFLEPKAACWEETMESIKSYSSHIDRRNSDNIKELNFSEMFVAQKRLDPFPFLPAEQDASDNDNRKSNCDVNEPTLHHTTCNYIEDLRSIRDDDLQCEQPDAILCNEQENGCNNQNDASADVSDKPASTLNPSLSVQSNDEHTEKQESQFDKNESGTIKLAEKARSCSKITDEKTHDPERDQCSTSYVEDKEASAEHLVEDDLRPRCISPKEDKFDAEVVNPKENSDENSTKVASPSKLNVESKDSLDEPKDTEIVKESVLTSNERNDEIDDSARDDSDSLANRETVSQQVLSVSIDHKDREETVLATESNISAEINFGQIDEQDTRDRGDSAVSKEDEPEYEPIASQNPSDVAFVERTLDEEINEQQSEKPESDGQKAEVSLKDQGNDEVDTCCSMVMSTSATALNLQTEENVCDLFASERREQNISEFTVIKSIKGDKKQCEESEANENCDSIIDSKLLCMDSSDCGIYAEDRCALTRMSEHDFTEDDSMVPMVWETSQIQEDAVNRLCSIDETIDFTGAVNSLQDNSLLSLDHLSLSRMSATKEPRVAEVITETESKAIDEIVPTVEESKATPSNDENKEQNEISSSSYEKIAYLRAVDCNANTKMVPKLVIKKSETSSKFVTKMSPSSITQDSIANKSVFQPKIPKMIIRNARSRPGTPSIEAVHEETPAQANIMDRASLTNEDLCESNSESSLQESNRNKIPKMKIKLDEKHSNKIVRADDDEEVSVKRKNVKKTIPKVKIKSTSRSDLADNSVCNSMTSQESRDPGKYEEKIPKLKLRKQERNRSSSPEVTRKRQSSSHSEVPVKKYKRSGRDETEHSTRRSNSSDSMRTNALECESKMDPLVCISEKIPKVIIKRTSASAEFKCELSKSCKNVIAKSAKWQPEVKLERYRILDSMVKDLKLTLSPVTLRAIDKISASRKDSQGKQGDYKLSRSNSTSDLLPANNKFKQRRMSDYDCKRFNDASRVGVYFAPSDTDYRYTKTCTTPKKNASLKSYKSTDDKDNKRSSRSHNNSRSETDVTSPGKETNQSLEKANLQKATSQCDKQDNKTDSFDINCEQAVEADEDTILDKLGQKNILKHPSNSNFKLALKELKATSKTETSFTKLTGPSETSPEENLQTDKEQRKERDDDSFFSKNDSKVMMKKERLNSSDMDNDCTLQDDIDLLKDDSASMLDNFEVANSTVIKVESSDESQSTIEILPASPDDNHSELERHMIEDGDTEQLYSADAIPTQFELELEITDNSNTDLLDVSMPKLDPIICYNSRRASEESKDQIAKLERYNKSDASPGDKNSLGKDNRVEIDISGNDRSASENGATGSVGEVFLKAPCCKATGFVATRENFCCNDSLIKEVLAAKETLKKCLSKSRYDVQSSANGNARPKTAAEKKQGSSFDINILPEVPSSDASQDCHSDVAPQKSSTPMANKHNKTENISNAEKSDKKHSKQSKSSSMKKKPRSPERNEADSKKTVKDAPECNRISLKTFKQLGQAASNESLACTVHLNEKRKYQTGRNDDVPHQDPQRKEKNPMSSYKIPKISRSTDQGNNTSNAKETKPKEDNMPILEPEVNVNFDTNSDRETSRSPPVITIQDSEDLDIAESKLLDDKVITSSIKVESNTKDVHKKSEMSIIDLINQLAYHEKATIKHRRYCNLCERWFPTTSRHRRHLAGYQHRHIELTQRRSIHALFTLFTGKPCPRLVPANVVRSDCSVGELTPLQIAVQDVTKCLDRTQQSPRKENDVDK